MGISAPCQARVAMAGIFVDFVGGWVGGITNSESIKLNQRMDIVTDTKRIVERRYKNP